MFDLLDINEIDWFYPLWLLVSLMVTGFGFWMAPEVFNLFESVPIEPTYVQPDKARLIALMVGALFAGIGLFIHWLTQVRPMSTPGKSQLKAELGLPSKADDWDIAQAMARAADKRSN